MARFLFQWRVFYSSHGQNFLRIIAVLGDCIYFHIVFYFNVVKKFSTKHNYLLNRLFEFNKETDFMIDL